MRKSSIIALAAAFTFGFGLAYFILDRQYSPPGDHANESAPKVNSDQAFNMAAGRDFWAQSKHSINETAPVEGVQAEKRLAKKVRVLCWVMTGPANHAKKAIHVKETWGKRCDKLIFMSSQSDEKLGAVGLPNVKEGREWLCAKSTGAFKYIWEHHRDDADWFLKADDDTYVILENLRYLLSQYEAEKPIYFGCRFQLSSGLKYMSGGAGYVLSKEALRRLNEQGILDQYKCNQSRAEAEDTIISKCLEAVGVEVGDSRDPLGRFRFLPYAPKTHVSPGGMAEKTGYWKRIYYPQKHGMEGCSDRAISFHYVEPWDMYALEYLIYHLRVNDPSPGDGV